MRLRSKVAIAAALVSSMGLSAPRASAQDAVAAFYKDKTVTIIIGSTAAGGTDVYGRLIARHIGRHIPGNPRVIPQNLPGAGSLAAASHIYSSAPKDGTQIGTVLAGAIVDPLLGDGTRRYDPTQFNFIGNANAETAVCVVRADAPAKSFADTLKTELIVGGTGPGSALTVNPVFLRNVFSAKIKLVAGYPGSREISLAVEKGELHGVCGLNWTSARQQYRDVLTANGPFRIILQEDIQPLAELAKAGVPLVTSFAKTEEDRQILEVFYGQGALTRPFFAPPDVPMERIAALRKAFLAAALDPDLLAEAQKSGLDVAATPGEEVQALVAKLFATRQTVLVRLKQMMDAKP